MNLYEFLPIQLIFWSKKLEKNKIGDNKKRINSMSITDISDECKVNKHVDCKYCMCRCHIPGTMENLAKRIAKIEKDEPGFGESL